MRYVYLTSNPFVAVVIRRRSPGSHLVKKRDRAFSRRANLLITTVIRSHGSAAYKGPSNVQLSNQSEVEAPSPSPTLTVMSEADKRMDMEEAENQIVAMDFCSGSVSEPSHDEFGSGSQPLHEDFGSGSQPSQASCAETTTTASEDPIDVDKEPVKDQGRRAMADWSEWWGISSRSRTPMMWFNKDPTQGTIQATYGEGVGIHKFDPDAIRTDFTEMIIVDELPFAFGEKAGFRKFMSIVCPRFTVTSRRTTTRDVVKRFFKEKAMLKKFFKDSCQRVCLTTDCWTSQQLDGYMTLTASFIDENWILHKKIINFFLVKGHKGDDIGANLVRCMAEWGMERVLTVTIDNASSNDNGMGYLRRHLNKSPSNIAKGKYLHMRCAAHIVNLIVQDGLKEVDLSIQRVRAAVRYIRNGGTRITKFKEIVAEEKVDAKAFLRIDVPTRWNSTFLMLKSANVYEKVFTRLGEEDLTYKFDLSEENDGFGCPEEADWENAKKMEEFLGHFYDLTTRVSATLTSKGGRQGMLKDVIAKKLKMNNGASSNSKSELDKYLAEDTEDVEMKLDILAWWKINESRFPVLAHLARDVLAIPILTVASESAHLRLKA
ncbi:hypothetical protein ACQ4PT_042524 [Festuca glaucescens]